jgi:putative hydroxymethylpyrimidine transport system permease protein
MPASGGARGAESPPSFSLRLLARGWHRPPVTLAILLLAWEAVVRLTGVPPFILPGPAAVGATLLARWPLLFDHALITAFEIVAGLLLATALGVLTGLLLAAFAPARRWLLPVLVLSQALPVFALAPILVLWLGYGPASKIAMAVLIIYFPLTAALYDGLRRTDPGLSDVATLQGAGPWQRLRLIRLPAALPALASGLRVAAAVAPIGAVVGEWVGASAGLGYLMLHANARMQIDLMFAALAVLCTIALTLYATVDHLAARLTPWQADSVDHDREATHP